MNGLIKTLNHELLLKNILRLELVDYKLMCFNGKVKCSLVCEDRFSDLGLKITFFDFSWNVMPLERPNHPRNEVLRKCPECYDEMVVIAEKLSENIPFLRVDFMKYKEEFILTR